MRNCQSSYLWNISNCAEKTAWKKMERKKKIKDKIRKETNNKQTNILGRFVQMTISVTPGSLS